MIPKCTVKRRYIHNFSSIRKIWKQVFSEVHSAKDVDTETLPRELWIRNSFMQLTSLSKTSIIDKNVNLNILSLDILNHLQSVLFRSHIKIHTSYAVVLIKSLPLLGCDF